MDTNRCTSIVNLLSVNIPDDSVMLQLGGSLSGYIRGLDCRGHGLLFACAGSAGDLNQSTYDVVRSGSSTSIANFSSLGISLVKSFADGTYLTSAATSLACPFTVRCLFAFAKPSDVFRCFLLCGADTYDISSVGNLDFDFCLPRRHDSGGRVCSNVAFFLVVVTVMVDSMVNTESLMYTDCGQLLAII